MVVGVREAVGVGEVEEWGGDGAGEALAATRRAMSGERLTEDLGLRGIGEALCEEEGLSD